MREAEQQAAERLQALLPAGEQRPAEELQLEASLAEAAQRLLASVSSEACRQVCGVAYALAAGLCTRSGAPARGLAPLKCRAACTAGSVQEVQQALEEELAQQQEVQQLQQQEAQAAADAQAAALAARKRHWVKPQGPFDNTPKRPTAGSTLRWELAGGGAGRWAGCPAAGLSFAPRQSACPGSSGLLWPARR